MKRRGSMALEAVIVLPILIFIIFVIIQMTFVWTAHQMTLYAAYCGARAALVYNPEDYAGQFDGDDPSQWQGGGVVKRAAEHVLGWISFSHKGSSPIKLPTDSDDYELPASDDISDQVRVKIEEGGTGDLPAVKVTVDFNYPLIVPLASILFVKDAQESKGAVRGDEHKESSFSWHSLHVVESYTLPKPWSTKSFPKVPAEDKKALGIDKDVKK